MKRIGVVVAGSAYPVEGFKTALRHLGWEEGKNIGFDVRAAEGQLHLLPGFAAEVVDLGVDLIAVIGAVTLRAVRQATTSIPIVFVVVVEPVRDGLVTDIRRPGQNLTGVTTFDPQQARTQLTIPTALFGRVGAVPRTRAARSRCQRSARRECLAAVLHALQ